MKRLSIALLLLGVSVLQLKADVRPILKDWKFQLGDVPEARLKGYDDSSWRTLSLPHDWAFEKGYHIDGAQRENGGYASGGIGWYRKELVLSDKERRADKVFLDFEAAYMNSEVWFNGHYLGKCPYGYIPFSYEVTPYLQAGKNVIAVRIDNALEPSARWYHGCGIYAQVQLRTHAHAYLEKDGTFIHTANSRGEVALQSLVKSSKTQRVRLKVEIRDSRGRIKARRQTDLQSMHIADTLDLSMKVKSPKLWSPEHPYLYKAHLQLFDEKGHELDVKDIQFGFRDIAWNAENGFFLNGQQYKLHGVCEHLEGGPVGAMYTRQLLRWKLQLLKDMGCNAVRTAHNPQIPAFYDLCDEMGLLVMDEVFDGWSRKAPHDYGSQAFATHWEHDLRTFIRRDRNHPSVFLYSVGNETRGPLAPQLVRVCHEEDPTRQVTSGSGTPAAMDVVGINGGSEEKSFLQNYKPVGKAFVATENPHTWQVRGYYRTRTWYRDGYHEKRMMDIPHLTDEEIFTYDWTAPGQRRNRKQIFNSSYDNATVRATARHILEAARDKSWFSGNFRWTGFDYLGEAGYVHGGWPFRAFQSGALDLAGFPKDLYYLYQSEWTKKDMVHILPHWSHPVMALGTVIPVWVYTTGDEVELWLNGKSLGRKKKGRAWNEMQCEFRVPWQPGKIEAVAYRKGKKIARAEQVTADVPVKLDVNIENPKLKNDGEDVSILTLRQVDASGTLYPYGENRVYVAVTGPARVLSFENGNPVDTECNFGATSRRCFFGLNRLFVQSVEDKSDPPVSVVLAAIHGDKKLKQSNLITLSCQSFALRGRLPKHDFHIHYTTDGSQPTLSSPLYQSAFSLSSPTTVRAVVYDGEQRLMEMKESFGPAEGLYWGKKALPVHQLTEQMETLQLTDCAVQSTIKGFHGKGYAVPVAGKGVLSWYQENDGDRTETMLQLRYALPEKNSSPVMGLYQNNKLLRRIEFRGKKLWNKIKVPVTLWPGANQFELRSIGPAQPPCLDEMEWL